MHNIGTVFRREFASYFATPLAFVFIVIYLILVGVFAFWFGGFYERGQADLAPFFTYHPWLYLFLIPALSMAILSSAPKLPGAVAGPDSRAQKHSSPPTRKGRPAFSCLPWTARKSAMPPK